MVPCEHLLGLVRLETAASQEQPNQLREDLLGLRNLDTGGPGLELFAPDLGLIDLFEGTPYEVELEKDLSAKRQLLDVVVVRRTDGVLAERLPDGLDNLADHNLITYKSLREPLDDWALKERTGHYVNYRKQTGTGRRALLPEDAFRL